MVVDPTLRPARDIHTACTRTGHGPGRVARAAALQVAPVLRTPSARGRRASARSGAQ